MTYPGLPKRVKVGPITYRVLASVAEHDAAEKRSEAALDGWSSGRKAEIGVRPGDNVQFARQVMVHELLHQIITVAALEISETDEEVIVRTLEAGLLGVLRDNPALVKWLTDK